MFYNASHSFNWQLRVLYHLSPLAVDSIEQAQGYRFDREIQSIYLSRDLLEFTPRHQWPEIQLPVPQAVPQPEAPAPSVNQELLQGLQSSHDAAVNLLHTQGIDACKVYKERDADTILAHIRPHDVKCSYCGRVCKTSQKLKAHIRSHHLRAAAYKCPVCNKSFGASYALKQHKKSHEDGGRKFLCAVCGKDLSPKAKSMSTQKGTYKEESPVPTVPNLWLTRELCWSIWKYAPSALNHLNRFFPKQRRKPGLINVIIVSTITCTEETWCAIYTRIIRISDEVLIGSRWLKTAPRRLSSASW